MTLLDSWSSTSSAWLTPEGFPRSWRLSILLRTSDVESLYGALSFCLMTMRAALIQRLSRPGVRLALTLGAVALAVWLVWIGLSVPRVRSPAPAQPSPALVSSAPIPSPRPTVYTCVRVGHLPRISALPCPPDVDLQMVEIPPPSAASH